MSPFKIITSGLLALLLWITLAAAKITKVTHTLRSSTWLNMATPCPAYVTREVSLVVKCAATQRQCVAHRMMPNHIGLMPSGWSIPAARKGSCTRISKSI